jgi:hypothetical protein
VSPSTQLSATGDVPHLLVAQDGVMTYAPPLLVVCTQILPGPQMMPPPL